MKRTVLTCLLLFTSVASRAQPRAVAHHFATQGDHFTLDGKPFKILSGELHYSRIPREYWHARLKMAKAMGLNTIATYVFWNVHESSPGTYDFSGQNDLAGFIHAAQEEGLYVILRSGPYACAEWDLGGLPAWLLADQESAQAIRTNHPSFMVPAERWIRRLSKEVLPLQIGRGGPILMTQIENEYGQFGSDHSYIAHLRDIYLKLGFTDTLLYSADNWRHIPEGSIPALFAAVNFGVKNHQGGMDALASARPGQALFVSEYWPGWFDHWGHPHETRPIEPQLEDVRYILTRGAGINIYMFHGGTSFGFMAGSSYINDKFLPDVTSYDYDAPLDESGRPTPKYYAYRKLLAHWSACGNESCLPKVPPTAPPIAIPRIEMTQVSSFWNNLPKAIASALPAPMEKFGQNYGYILYRTQIPEAVHGAIAIKDVHDFANLYLDGKFVGSMDRRNAAPDGSAASLPVSTNAPAQLDILVADDGRVNVDHTMRTENKGITQGIALDGRPLSDWRIYSLPMDVAPVTAGLSKSVSTVAPAYFSARFHLRSVGDTFLDISQLGKGVIWINGHNIGRFWNTGPQQTLYVPGPWLKTGDNEIVIFDMLPGVRETVAGREQPLLAATVVDTTTSNQE